MAQCCNHFAGYNAAGFHAQFFANGNAHGRRGLHNNDFVGVVNGIPDFFGIVTFNNGAGRANAGALAAVAARHIAEVLFKRS